MEFEEYKIVPEVIPAVPASVAKISYVSGVSASLGNALTPTEVQDQPTVEWEADPDAFYTLCMTDPDNLGKAPEWFEWHHWLVGNIPGNALDQGEVLSQYIGSGPPEGTGIHRYIFLIYKQSDKLTFDEPRLPFSTDNRANFKIQNFAEKYKLGTPIAGNFYQAEFDDYVPLLYKKLGA